VDSVTPDEPRRAPIRWHVATVRDARTESPTARTLVLDGVFDLAALEDLAVGQHADAHSTLLTPRRRSAEGGESAASCPTSSKQKHRTPLPTKAARAQRLSDLDPRRNQSGPHRLRRLDEGAVKVPTPIDRAELQRLLRDEQAQLVEVLLEAARRFADIEPE
jgi:hypothetical protein